MKCKKSRLLALCISLVLVLAGCTASGQSITPTYPRIEYRNSAYNFDPYNREIPIPEGYVLNEGYSFDIMETDAGCDVVLHFVESEGELPHTQRNVVLRPLFYKGDNNAID